MRRHHRATLLAVLLAVWAATGASPGGQQDPPGSFPVPGYWEPVDGRTTRAFDTPDRNGLLWHQGFRAEGRPRWQWRPRRLGPGGGLPEPVPARDMGPRRPADAGTLPGRSVLPDVPARLG